MIAVQVREVDVLAGLAVPWMPRVAPRRRGARVEARATSRPTSAGAGASERRPTTRFVLDEDTLTWWRVEPSGYGEPVARPEHPHLRSSVAALPVTRRTVGKVQAHE